MKPFFRHSSRPTACLILLLGLASGSTVAAEKITFHNDTGYRQYIWIWPYKTKRYMRPIVLQKGEKKTITFNIGEDFYIVATDDEGRETPFGKFNITQFCTEHPSPIISLESVAETAYRMAWQRLPDGRCVWLQIPDTVVRYSWRTSSKVRSAPNH
jgi:hypothetical protein